jgi:hypothetical protein
LSSAILGVVAAADHAAAAMVAAGARRPVAVEVRVVDGDAFLTEVDADAASDSKVSAWFRSFRLRGQALAGRRRAAQQHGRGRVQARRPRPDLPQVHLRRLRGSTPSSKPRSARAPTPRTRTSTAPSTSSGCRRRPAGRTSSQRQAADHRQARRRRDGRHRARQPLAQGRAAQGLRPPGLDKQRLGQLIDLVGDIGLGDAGENRSKDILGRVYEYFLSQFASAEGKKGGQFYTPRCVVRVLVEMLAPYKGRVYDPCCGSGGMFVQSEKFVEAHGGGSATSPSTARSPTTPPGGWPR